MDSPHPGHSMSKVARIAVVKDATRRAIQDARAALSGRVADILAQYVNGSGADDVVRAVSDVYREGALHDQSDRSVQRNPEEITEALQDVIVALVRRLKALQITAGKPETEQLPAA
ncbi:MAG: hypothetical protein V1876_00965 [Candidatus Peregrinibacteria bacterium]